MTESKYPEKLAELFEQVKSVVTGAVGTTSAAIVFRRTAVSLKSTTHCFDEFSVERKGTGYFYRLPAIWESETDQEGLQSFRLMILALLPIVKEMAGMQLASKVAGIPSLAEHRILTPDDLVHWSEH